jgi:hypothetical protein
LGEQVLKGHHSTDELLAEALRQTGANFLVRPADIRSRMIDAAGVVRR